MSNPELGIHSQLATRRDVLRTGLKIATGLVIGVSSFENSNRAVAISQEEPQPGVSVSPIELLQGPPDVEKAEQLAIIAADALKRVIPDAPLLESLTDAQLFAEEFIPYLGFIGLQDSNQLVYPTIVTTDFGDMLGAGGWWGTNGASMCDEDGKILLNERFFNKYSAKNRPDRNYELVGVVAHESCHSNNVSCTDESGPPPGYVGSEKPLIEGTTQLAATETLFAMHLDGGRVAFPAAIANVLEFATRYVFVECYRNEALDYYEAFLKKLPYASERLGEWELLQAQGEDVLWRYASAMEEYGHNPFIVLANAIASPELEAKGLPVPDRTLRFSNTYTALSMLNESVDEYPLY